MIEDKLLAQLKKSFPPEKFHTGKPPEPIAIFSAKHPSVGELSIWDDGGEVTVSIGDITHGHFNSFRSNATQDEIESEIVEQILDFLRDLFADKYLLHKSQNSGGWQHLDYIEKPFKQQENTEYFVWSGLFDVKNLKQLMPQN